MCTENTLKIILKDVVKYAKSELGDLLNAVILYGSYARGNSTEDSDIDIVALVRGSREDLQAKLKKIWDMSAELGLANDVIVSPTVIPYDEFVKYKQTLPYYRNIAEEGKKIG